MTCESTALVKVMSVQSGISDDEKITVSFEAEGTLESREGAAVIRYVEPTDSDVTGADVELIIKGDGRVVMKKTGSVDVTIVFSEKNGVFKYSCALGVFDLYIYDVTKKVKVTDTAAEIILDYISEIARLDPQRIKMRISAKGRVGRDAL